MKPDGGDRRAEAGDERLAALAEAYDRCAEARAAARPPPWKTALADEFLDMLPLRPRILDLGAGTGVFARRFRDGGATVRCLDLAPRHVAMCQAAGLDARLADFTSEEIGAAEYDGVWAMNSLLHVPTDQLVGVFERIARALVPGGLALVCVWGGVDHVGPLPDDPYDPPREFVLYADERFVSLDVAPLERVETRLLAEHDDRGLHPQVMLVRRPPAEIG